MSNARRRMETTFWRVVAVVAATVIVGVLVLTVVSLFGEDQRFTRYWVEANANSDGSIDVEMDLEYDFAEKKSHGIYLTFLTRQRIEGNPDQWRVLHMGDFQAESPTAASTLQVERSRNGVGLYIGDPTREDVTGVHSYRVKFTVDGIINSGVGAGDEDEIYWNVIGTDFEQPLNDVRVTLNTPAEAFDAGCWHGKTGSTDQCQEAAASDGGATFTHDHLEAGEGLTIAASYPPGTFNDVGPFFRERASFGNTMGRGGVLAAGIGGSLLAAAVGLVTIPWLRRDRRYEGVTPGQVPPAGSDAPLIRAPVRPEAAVQFTPPEGLRPIEAGVLVAAKAKPAFHAATLVDLAVRGYIRIETGEEQKWWRKTGWKLVQLRQNLKYLDPVERRLMQAVFSTKSPVTIAKLSHKSRQRIAKLTLWLEGRVKSKGWFTTEPRSARKVNRIISWVVFGVGAAITGIGALNGFGMLGVPAIVLAVAMRMSAKYTPMRTAEGHALYMQCLGFKKYIETAEANQLNFEADEDIFSAYLPYAMVFGVTKQWIKLFEHLAEEGKWEMDPGWYAGAAMFSSTSAANAFSANLSGLQALASSTGSTIGSSSGSSSSFGGSSGGGVGGGGGGSW